MCKNYRIKDVMKRALLMILCSTMIYVKLLTGCINKDQFKVNKGIHCYENGIVCKAFEN